MKNILDFNKQNINIKINMRRILLVFIALISLSSSKAPNIFVDPETSLFVDEYDRYLVFHGVNVVRKLAPYYPQLNRFDSNYSLTDVDLINIRSWGFNFIRLHVAWEGVQPQRNQYNDTYIKKLREVIQKCNKYGIYVLLDAHQDLFNKQFCGNGFPDWTVKKNNFPSPIPIDLEFNEEGLPNRKKCLEVHFSVFYFTQDLNKFQEEFFTNKNGLIDQFSKFWQRVVKVVKQQPNLIGYQILNEPIGQDFGKNPFDIFTPNVANNKYLYPAYKKIYSAIREIDNNRLIFYEASVLDPFAKSFQSSIGPQNQRPKQVLSYHTYCPFVNKLGQPTLPLICKLYDRIQVDKQQKALRKLKIGGFLTEFGALSNNKRSIDQIKVITDLTAKYFRSWAYWQFKYLDDITTAASPGTTESFYDVDGNLQQDKVKALARPYAYAICGNPQQQLFDKGIFTFSWIPNRNCRKNTQIFLSTEFYFPNGFEVLWQNCQQCQISELSLKGYYQILLDSQKQQKVTLTVKPR